MVYIFPQPMVEQLRLLNRSLLRYHMAHISGHHGHRAMPGFEFLELRNWSGAVPFLMNLSIPNGTAPARLRFSYTYWLAEEPPVFRYGGYEGVPHFGHFDAPP